MIGVVIDILNFAPMRVVVGTIAGGEASSQSMDSICVGCSGGHLRVCLSAAIHERICLDANISSLLLQ